MKYCFVTLFFKKIAYTSLSKYKKKRFLKMRINFIIKNI